MGAFGQAVIDYNKYLYITVTGRNDWTSTIPKERNSFFYPGVSSSFVFSDAFPRLGNFMTGKLRAAYAAVGKDARPYAYRPSLEYKTTSFGGYGYGFTGKRGQFWSDWLAGAAPADIVETWVGNHFELVDIVVDPARRGQGIAGLLHDELIAGLPQDRALLATEPDDGAAARLYTGRGWQIIAPEIDGAKALYGLDLRAR